MASQAMSAPLTTAPTHSSCIPILPPAAGQVSKFVPVLAPTIPSSPAQPLPGRTAFLPAQVLQDNASPVHELLPASGDGRGRGWRVARAVLTPTPRVMCCGHGILPLGWLLNDFSAGVGYCLAVQLTAQEGSWRERLFHCWDGDSGLLLFMLCCCLICSGCIPKAERNMGPALEGHV